MKSTSDILYEILVWMVWCIQIFTIDTQEEVYVYDLSDEETAASSFMDLVGDPVRDPVGDPV